MADIVISSSKEEAQQQAPVHACACGDHDAGYPELDARVIPHAIRHAAIFGVIDSVATGGGIILIAPHNPLPLLEQLEQRTPGTFEITYLKQDPEEWHLRLVRKA